MVLVIVGEKLPRSLEMPIDREGILASTGEVRDDNVALRYFIITLEKT